MKKKYNFFLFFICFNVFSNDNIKFECVTNQLPIPLEKNLTYIAFGSCANENKEQPILNDIAQSQPDLFIYLGDNVYVDSKKEQTFLDTYSKLACKEEYKNLISKVPVLAVWDDHDYGKNDAGKFYIKKDFSKKCFLNFFQEPPNSDRYNHKGIYHSLYFGDNEHKVQIILLDTRTFRDNIKGVPTFYKETFNPNKTMLGIEQWKWLEAELKKPVKIRIIVSSTQFSIEKNGWESWANFPLEQQKMANLIASTKANGVLFISGDIHHAELSKKIFENTYPIYDCTSSGITNIITNTRNNNYRIGEPISKINYGSITIDWNSSPIAISYNVYTLNNQLVFQHQLTIEEISFKP